MKLNSIVFSCFSNSRCLRFSSSSFSLAGDSQLDSLFKSEVFAIEEKR